MVQTTEKRDRTGNRVGSETPKVRRVKAETPSVRLSDAWTTVMAAVRRYYRVLMIVGALVGSAYGSTLAIGALGSETRAVDNRVTEVVKNISSLAGDVKSVTAEVSALAEKQVALLERLSAAERAISKLPASIGMLDRVIATLEGEVRAMREIRIRRQQE